MANSVLQNMVLPAAIIAGCFAAIIGLTGPLDRGKPKLADGFTDSDLSMNGSRLKGFALGMEGLLEDWYWVRALQYIGDKMVASKDANIDVEDLTSLNPRLLYPLLQNATDLDPHFIGAYSYGAIVLPAIDKQKAIEFATKGVNNNPTEWRLYQYLGFIYWKVGDYEKAADTYKKGAEIQGSSSFMKLMAASMKTEGGSRETARSIYTQMLSESDDQAVQITADRRLKQLDWYDERDAINQALSTFSERNGRCANSFGEIAPMLMQVKLPEGRQFRIDAGKRLVDPTDAPYKLDKDKCVVTLDIEKTKIAPEN
jgi:tetratricopeptide (TPR) repeat protein